MMPFRKSALAERRLVHLVDLVDLVNLVHLVR